MVKINGSQYYGSGYGEIYTNLVIKNIKISKNGKYKKFYYSINQYEIETNVKDLYLEIFMICSSIEESELYNFLIYSFINVFIDKLAFNDLKQVSAIVSALNDIDILTRNMSGKGCDLIIQFNTFSKIYTINYGNHFAFAYHDLGKNHGNLKNEKYQQHLKSKKKIYEKSGYSNFDENIIYFTFHPSSGNIKNVKTFENIKIIQPKCVKFDDFYDICEIYEKAKYSYDIKIKKTSNCYFSKQDNVPEILSINTTRGLDLKIFIIPFFYYQKNLQKFVDKLKNVEKTYIGGIFVLKTPKLNDLLKITHYINYSDFFSIIFKPILDVITIGGKNLINYTTGVVFIGTLTTYMFGGVITTMISVIMGYFMILSFGTSILLYMWSAISYVFSKSTPVELVKNTFSMMDITKYIGDTMFVVLILYLLYSIYLYVEKYRSDSINLSGKNLDKTGKVREYEKFKKYINEPKNFIVASILDGIFSKMRLYFGRDYNIELEKNAPYLIIYFMKNNINRTNLVNLYYGTTDDMIKEGRDIYEQYKRYFDKNETFKTFASLKIDKNELLENAIMESYNVIDNGVEETLKKLVNEKNKNVSIEMDGPTASYTNKETFPLSKSKGKKKNVIEEKLKYDNDNSYDSSELDLFDTLDLENSSDLGDKNEYDDNDDYEDEEEEEYEYDDTKLWKKKDKNMNLKDMNMANKYYTDKKFDELNRNMMQMFEKLNNSIKNIKSNK